MRAVVNADRRERAALAEFEDEQSRLSQDETPGPPPES